MVVAIIGILAAILLPALNQAREYSKRAVCLGNLKQLQLAWMMYADDNNGWIPGANIGRPVNAKGFTPRCDIANGDCWFDSPHAWGCPGAMDADFGNCDAQSQQSAIKAGELWPYVQNFNMYKCPNVEPGQIIAYGIVDYMRGSFTEGCPYTATPYSY